MSMDKQRAREESREKALNAECGFPAPRKLKPEAQEALMAHLYTQCMTQVEKQKEKRELELQKANEITVKQMSEAELMDSIDRMYYQEKSRRDTKAEHLAKKYAPPKKNKKLDADTVASINERLFESTKGRFEKRRGELWEKHIAPMEPSFPKLTADQMTAVSERLSAKSS
jgi:hypothetical protein